MFQRCCHGCLFSFATGRTVRERLSPKNDCLLQFFELYHFFMRWLLVFLMSSCMAFGESIRGVVINVIDGDTITLLEKTPEQKRTCRIRLEGIDTPERGQNGYEGAKEYLENLIWGETVTVKYSQHDRYGRILGEVWYGKVFVNEELVKDGWAWIYKNFPPAGNSLPLKRRPGSPKKAFGRSRIPSRRGNGKPRREGKMPPESSLLNRLPGKTSLSGCRDDAEQGVFQ